jgi:hypothetical protein
MALEPYASFVDRFAPAATDYAAFRPTYPPALFAWLAAAAPIRTLAWNCATGTGQDAIMNVTATTSSDPTGLRNAPWWVRDDGHGMSKESGDEKGQSIAAKSRLCTLAKP